MKLKEFPKSVAASIRLKLLDESLVKQKKEESVPVIVSLTAIPSRFKTLHVTIRSLLQQRPQPEKVVLWVNEDHLEALPVSLTCLVGDVFEIRGSCYDFPHLKLMQSLEHFPDNVIVTADDDLIYPSQTVGELFRSHLENGNQVVGHRCREISYDDGELLPYKQWSFTRRAVCNANLLMPLGSFMTLYPPKVLDPRVGDVDLFLKLSPKADDLWFKAMSLLNRKKSVASVFPVEGPIPLMGTQKVSLKKSNVSLDQNRIQWLQISEYFADELSELLDIT